MIEALDRAVQAFGEILLPIALIVALGAALGSGFAFDIRSLNRLSIYLFSPSLIFVTLIRIDVPGAAVAQLTLQLLAVVAATLACAYAAAPLLGLGRERRGGLLLASTFMNSGNFGLSVSRFAFGEPGFQYAIISYLVQTILSQTLAVYLASAGNGTRRAALGQVLRLPLIYAVALALALRLLGVQLTEGEGFLATGIYRGLRMLGDATLPFLLVVLGVQLSRRGPLPDRPALATAVAIRLLLAIPVAYAAGLLVGLSGMPFQVGVLQAAMPTAVNMTIIALEFDAWPEFVTGAVVVSTLASLLTLTALLVALGI